MRPHTSRAHRRAAAPLAVGLLIAIGASLTAALPAALAAPRDNKVTICHRTHSETNPYRRITVSLSAADGQGRNDHTSHDDVYAVDGDDVPVFDPTIDYPANRKWWGDIIPPVRSSPGLNWQLARAQEIYTGSGASFGLCSRMSAKQFFDAEVAAGVPAADVLADLDAQASRDDADLLHELGVAKFSDLDPENLPESFTEAPAAPEGAKAPAGFSAERGKQKLAVYVWYDLDRDGAVDADERPAPGVAISIGAVVDVAPAGFAPASTLVMAVGELTTNADGLVTEETIAAGQWDVTATAPASTEVTYDSEGASDGSAVVDVPVDSAGFAWIGLVPAATDGGATDGGATDGGATDGGATDGGATDGGATDGGATDGGATDGGATDEGAANGGAADSGATGDAGGAVGDAEGGAAAEGATRVSPLLAWTGSLDTATLAVGAGALVVLGVAFARRASSARRRSEQLLDAE